MAIIRRKHASAMGYLHDWLEPDEDGSFNALTWCIVTLVILSLVSLAIETEVTRDDTPILDPARAHLITFVTWVNQIVVWVFAAEFFLRFISEGVNPKHRGVSGRIRFLFTPIAMADLLAFAPELIIVLLFPDASPPWLAAMRALRLFRLFKLARYVPAFGIVGAAVKRAGAPLLASLAVAAAQVYVASMLLYFLEGRINKEAFGSITRALWWAVVTLTTVGYGDVFPQTVMGRVAAGLIAVAGIGIVALPTGILASAFAEEFRLREEARARALANIATGGGDVI